MTSLPRSALAHPSPTLTLTLPPVHPPQLFEDQAGYEIADGAVHRMVERAIALDGTCTGEHGVGVGKKEYLRAELGDGTVQLMKLVKDAIDPQGIMNPGKVSTDTLAVASSST